MPLVVCLALGLAACTKYPPFTDDPTTLIGQWGIDNNNSRQADEPPILKHLTVYPDHIDYMPGSGTYYAGGEWRGDGFWCQAKDGSGEIEAVKVTAPEFVDVRLGAFLPGSSEVVTLYKEKGSPAEMKALAEKFPGPITYPPPAGVITVGLTEFQLRALPWQPGQTLRADTQSDLDAVWGVQDRGASKDEDAEILCYHSDDPRLVELRVTVRRHKVVAVSGGNG